MALVARERDRALLSSCARPLVVRGARQPCHGTPGEADGGGRHVDGTAPDGWYADIAGWGVPPPWQRELDELISTLSYDGWQDDVADTKDVWNPVHRKCIKCASSSRSTTADRRLTRPGWPVPLVDPGRDRRLEQATVRAAAVEI